MTVRDAGVHALCIAVTSPDAPESRVMMAAAQAEMLTHYRLEEIFSLSADEAAGSPNVVFLVARVGDRPVGCAALVDEMRHGVIHRLYVVPEARGLGVGRALIAALEAQARDLGLRVLRLETGTKLAAAVTLYRAAGYNDGPAFGSYPTSADSVFLEKRLD